MSSMDAMLEGASCEEIEKVVIGNNKEKFFQVGAQLHPQEKQELMVFLRKNINVFAWSAYEALGVDPDLICHHLNVNSAVVPKKQPRGVHLKSILRLSKRKCSSLSRLGLLKRCFTLTGWSTRWW